MKRIYFLLFLVAAFVLAPQASHAVVRSTYHGVLTSGTAKPILVNLVGLWTLNEGSGFHVYSKGATIDNNILSYPEQYVHNAPLPGTNPWRGLTSAVTDYYAANPINGAVTASRVVMNTNELYRQVTMQAGTYVMSCYFISNTGSSLSSSYSVSGTGISVGQSNTITTSWTRPFVSFTVPSNNTLVTVKYLSGGASLDLSMYGAKLETGTAPTPYVAPNYLTLGSNAASNTNAPTWTSGGLSFSANTFAYGMIPTPAAFTGTATIYALVKQTGTTAASQTIFEEISETKVFLGYGSNSTCGSRCPYYIQFWAGDTTAITDAPANLVDGNWHIIAAANDGTTNHIYVDGQLILSPTASGSATTVGDFGISNYFSAWPGNVGAVGLYSAYHTPAQVAQMTAYFRALANSKGVSAPALQRWVVFEGDSNTDMLNGTNPPPNGYWWQTLTSTTPSFQTENVAKNGSALTGYTGGNVNLNLTYRATAVDATLAPGRKNVLSVLAGTNDCSVLGHSPATVESDLASYWSARTAAGWKVVAYTIPSYYNASYPSAQSCINSVNSWIYANWSTYTAALVDVAGNTNLGCGVTCAQNTTYFTDGIHFAVAAQNIVTNLAKTQIQSLF
jgi:hypothetical protein